MKITKEHLKSWNACASGYRWFLNKFPGGGDYADSQQDLLNDGRVDDAHWLTEKVYQSFFETSDLPRAEAAAGDKMIEALNNIEAPDVVFSNDAMQQASNSDWGQQASNSDWGQQASSGCCTRQTSIGNETRQASSGHQVKQASSGDWAQQASSGVETRQASSGEYTKQASSGRWPRQASSGYKTTHLATGALSKIAVSGSDSKITATGNNAVVVTTDGVRKIILGENGCAAVAYNDGTRTRFAIAYVGEKGIKAGVVYTVNDEGEFVKLRKNDS